MCRVFYGQTFCKTFTRKTEQRIGFIRKSVVVSVQSIVAMDKVQWKALVLVFGFCYKTVSYREYMKMSPVVIR